MWRRDCSRHSCSTRGGNEEIMPMTKFNEIEWRVLAVSLVIWGLLITGVVSVYRWVVNTYVQCLSDRGIHEEKQ